MHKPVKQSAKIEITNAHIKVFEPFGTLDKTNVKQLSREIKKSLKNGANIVLIDLTNIIFIDCSGLTTLASVRKTVQLSGGKLFLSSLSEPVKMLFELTYMEHLFEIFADRDEFHRNFVSDYIGVLRCIDHAG